MKMIWKLMLTLISGIMLSMGSSQVANATHLALSQVDYNIHMSINGTANEVFNSKNTSCTQIMGTNPPLFTCTANIEGTYMFTDANGSHNLKITAISGSHATITADDSQELLVMRNAKIMTDSTNPITLTLTFWRDFPANLYGTISYWGVGGGYLRRGSTQAAQGAINTYRGYVEYPTCPTGSSTCSNTNVMIANLASPPATCPPSTPSNLVFCPTSTTPLSYGTFTWDTFRATSSFTLSSPAQDHTVTGEITLTLKGSTDSLQLPNYSTSGLQVSGGASPGGGPSNSACDRCDDSACVTCSKYCDSCVKRSALGWVCRVFGWGCPACIIEDPPSHLVLK